MYLELVRSREFQLPPNLIALRSTGVKEYIYKQVLLELVTLQALDHDLLRAFLSQAILVMTLLGEHSYASPMHLYPTQLAYH